MNIKDYPKSYKLLQAFVKKNLIAFQKNITKDITGDVEVPEITDEWAEKMTEGMIITQRRSLLDFFDQQELFITIEWFQGNFIGKIVGTLFQSKEYKDRMECEMETFEQAFIELEEQLK